ncbi:MAG: hypothetical protein FWC00_02790 [Firmicutes bacterium]|nr:hypothetical protein [Bacillota bacterium]
MLSSLNKSDLEKMHRYGRTKDMLLLQEFFPEICPFREVVLVTNPDDVLKADEKFSMLNTNRRCDTPIGDKVLNRVWTSRDKSDEILDDLKTESQDAGIIMFATDYPTLKRYARDGAMSISVHLGNSIDIDILGKGFPGHYLTRNVCRHQSFKIPLDAEQIRRLNLGTIGQHQTFLTSPEQYTETKQMWEQELLGLGYPPKKYKEKSPPNILGFRTRCFLMQSVW